LQRALCNRIALAPGDGRTRQMGARGSGLAGI